VARKAPPGAGIESAIGVLPRRRLTGLGSAALILLVAVMVTGANLELHFIKQIGWVIAAAVIISAILAANGIRRFLRQGVLDPGTEAVLPELGARFPTRDLVKVKKWEGGWVGEPARVVIQYAAHLDDSDPVPGSRGAQKNFAEKLCASFSRRMDRDYRVDTHDRKRCRIELIPAPPVKVVPKSQQRAEQVAAILFGEGACVTTTLDTFEAVRSVNVKHDQGARMAFPARRIQVERVFTSMLPGRWRAKWDLETDQVLFEIRPPMPEGILYNTAEPLEGKLTHDEYKKFRIPTALNEDGANEEWHPAISPHILVIGGTGSGKTSFEHTLLTRLAGAQWRIWILDGKRIEFVGFKDWPNVELVASRIEHQVRMLHAAHELMERRYSQIENGTARVEEFDPLILIIDEYATFKARVIRWYASVKPKGAPAKPPVLDLLSDLARLARSAKIHLVLGIQRPDAEILGGEMRDNYGARLSLGRLSPQGAVMMWDSPAIGVAVPRNKPGRGYTLNENSLPVEVQTFYTPDPSKLDKNGDQEEWALLEELRPKFTSYPRKMITDPDPLTLGDDTIEPDYYAYASARIVEWREGLGADLDDDDEPEPEHELVSAASPALPSNVVALGARRRRPTPAPIRFEASDEEEEEEAPLDGDLDGATMRGYGEIQEGTADQIAEGDLLLTDPSLGLWGVVESVEPDILDPDSFTIDFRELNTGASELITITDSEVITYRNPEIKET